jgi:hypothetical protein
MYETHRPWKTAVTLCYRRWYVWLPQGFDWFRVCVCGLRLVVAVTLVSVCDNYQ